MWYLTHFIHRQQFHDAKKIKETFFLSVVLVIQIKKQMLEEIDGHSQSSGAFAYYRQMYCSLMMSLFIIIASKKILFIQRSNLMIDKAIKKWQG
jgi:hypothetical protein